MDPRLLGGSDRVSLALAAPEEPTPPAGGNRIALGGSLSRGVPGTYFGPDVNALTSGPHTSLYRWHVANDWRMWGTFGLASRQTVSRIGLDAPDRGPGSDEERWLRALAAMMARHQAQLNVRLLVEYDDGHAFVY